MTKVVAVTGGIGSGKSEACRFFGALGVPVIDLDQIAHAISTPGSVAMLAVRAQFGDDYFLADGQLDRSKLRETVFHQTEALAALNQIMHPAIRSAAVDEIAAQTGQAYVVLAIPLLVESQADWPMIDHVLVIDCDETLQVQRVLNRSRLSREMAQAIIAAQSTREARLAIANTVIDNSGALEELQHKIEEFHKNYRKTCLAP